MRSSHAASVISPTGVGKKLDALFTSTSSRPKRCTVSSTIAGRCAMLRRSAWKATAEAGRAALSSSTSPLASASE
jgi:hypothetical protein